MKKDMIINLSALLPGKDSQTALALIKQKRFDDLKEIVDVDIKKLEKIQDETGQTDVRLDGLYMLSDGLDDYVFIFEDTQYYEES